VNQLSSEIRYQFIKTIAPSYHKNGELLVAAGQANGKVVLCNFMPSQENHIEFTPRQQRPCLTLSWSQSECNLLAMGFDKNKSDHSISIWDIERGNASESCKLDFIQCT
jgi:WD40 repeat protein